MSLLGKATRAFAIGCLFVAGLDNNVTHTQGARPSAAEIADAVDALTARALKLRVLSGVGVNVTMDGRIAFARAFG